MHITQFQVLGKREWIGFHSYIATRKMRPQLTAEHSCIRAGYYHLVALVIQAAYKQFPSFHILYFIKIIDVLIAKQFIEALLKRLEILNPEIHQALIIEIKEEISLRQFFSQLLEQNRLAASTNSSDD